MVLHIEWAEGFSRNAIITIGSIDWIFVNAGFEAGSRCCRDHVHRSRVSAILVGGGRRVLGWTADHVISRTVLLMLGKNDALRAVAVHPLEIPDGVIVVNFRPKYMTPSPYHTLSS